MHVCGCIHAVMCACVSDCLCACVYVTYVCMRMHVCMRAICDVCVSDMCISEMYTCVCMLICCFHTIWSF